MTTVPNVRCSALFGDGPLATQKRCMLPMDHEGEHRSSTPHIESDDCHCGPTLNFVADDGTKHWIHHEPS